MAVQQNRKTSSKRNMRRSHDALVAENPHECPNCGNLRRPHHICGSCGYYGKKGNVVREVVITRDDAEFDEDAA